MVPQANIPLRAIDLFCGAGGLSEGFRAAGYDVSFALDFDEDSCATYRRNHRDARVECASITDFTPEDIERLAGGKVDVVLGGPSCQSFSTHGRRTGWVASGDPRNDLWEQMFKVVAHLRPKAFLMENVPGMVYFKSGSFGDKILKRFTVEGYTVRREILLAADWGVPQRRRRLFIVGVLGDNEFEFPEPTHLGGWRRDSLEMWEQKRIERGLLEHLTVWDAIGDLPLLGDGIDPVTTYGLAAGKTKSIAKRLRKGSRTLRDHEVRAMAEDTRQLIMHVPPGGTWRDIPPHLLPDRYRGMRRTDSTNLLGRLSASLPAYTITTQFNNVTTGCVTHPVEDRALSVREGARIQTFPDSYEFVGSLTSRCRQIGNAVPPLLAQVLAHSIAIQIGGDGAGDRHPAPLPPRRGTWSNLPSTDDEVAQARKKRDQLQDTVGLRLVKAAMEMSGLFFVESSIGQGAPRDGDILLSDARLAVMVNSCFWNGCPEHSKNTKSRIKWWAKKIADNQTIDNHAIEHWKNEGWDVAVFWEHERPEDVVRHIRELAEAKLHSASGPVPSTASAS